MADAKTSKPNLPAIVQDLGLAVKVDSLNKLLSQPPSVAWLKTHQGVQYQPVAQVKNSLIVIFQDYDWSIKNVQIMANSILVYGTLSVINPITGRMRHVDGVGAWPIQLDSGAKPLEIEKIKQGAIQKNAPAAESLAFKNAAKKLGNVFGDGKDDVEFDGVYSRDVPLDEIKQAHS